ncbi:MAG: zinc-ribbon domain-containing protein [Oscillospiraceae bacterium]
MQCRECHAELPQGARRCPQCGRPVLHERSGTTNGCVRCSSASPSCSSPSARDSPSSPRRTRP